MRTWREGATSEKAARHVAESIQAWHAGTWYDFAISRIDSAVFLGRVGLDRIRSNETANVGYWMRTGQTGQGIATAAVRLVARFGFEDLGLRRLELRIAADNLASRRVAEKVGATFEAVLPIGRTASRLLAANGLRGVPHPSQDICSLQRDMSPARRDDRRGRLRDLNARREFAQQAVEERWERPRVRAALGERNAALQQPAPRLASRIRALREELASLEQGALPDRARRELLRLLQVGRTVASSQRTT